MAINIKHSLNGLAAIKKIGIPQHLYDWLASSAVKVSITTGEFVFSLPEEIGGHIYSVPAPLSSMQKLAMNTLGQAAKQALRADLCATLEHIEDIHALELAGVDPTDTIAANHAPSKPSVLSKLPPLTVAGEDPPTPSEQPSPKKTGMWLPFPAEKMKSAPLTKLRDANQMYQPVLGTSAGSRYYLVAANKDLRVAARYMAHKLSVRIEGPGLGQHKNTILGAGISVHNDYASIHLDVGTDLTLANKTLGAILMGLGVPLETPFPELKKIAL